MFVRASVRIALNESALWNQEMRKKKKNKIVFIASEVHTYYTSIMIFAILAQLLLLLPLLLFYPKNLFPIPLELFQFCYFRCYKKVLFHFAYDHQELNCLHITEYLLSVEFPTELCNRNNCVLIKVNLISSQNGEEEEKKNQMRIMEISTDFVFKSLRYICFMV